jgi:hypothetical protein
MGMFNIDNVIKSPIKFDPWEHQIIKDFFQKKDFEKVIVASKKLEEIYKDKKITASDCLSIAEVYDIIGDEVFDIILEANRSLLENIESIVKNFSSHRRFEEYISFPSFHILPPYTDWQKIHDESSDKTVSVVVYLYPELSVGTTLYKKDNRTSKSKEINWRQNSAMLFCGKEATTWHDFCSRENPRVTLNFFLRTIQTTELFDEGDRYSWTFGNGLKTYVPKSLPKEKLKTLTSGYLFRKL